MTTVSFFFFSSVTKSLTVTYGGQRAVTLTLDAQASSGGAHGPVYFDWTFSSTGAWSKCRRLLLFIAETGLIL